MPIPKPRLTILIPPMMSLDEAAELLVLVAHEAQARVYCELNSVELFADPMKTTRGDVIAQWDAAQAAKRSEYATPKPLPGDEDLELDALVSAMRALGLLDDEARQRVLHYCHERFGHRVALAPPRTVIRERMDQS